MKLKDRTMRRKAQQMSDERTIEVLKRGTNGVLALLGDEDYPYALPISYVYHEGCIYFHSSMSGHKIDAVEGYGKASFCVIDHDEPQPSMFTTFYRSSIAFGSIGLVTDNKEKTAALRLLCEKYSQSVPTDTIMHHIEETLHRTAVIALRIEHLTGKESRHLLKRK